VYNVVNIISPNGLPLVVENAPVISQEGLESAATALLSSESSVYAHFTARRTRQEGNPMREWPAYILSLGTDNVFRSSVRVHGDASFVFDFATSDLETLPGTPLLAVRYVDVPTQIDVNLRVGKLLWDGRAEVYALGRNLAAFVRDREDLVQMPPYPVGATLLVGLSLFED
jgi:hypothetical protein